MRGLDLQCWWLIASCILMSRYQTWYPDICNEIQEFLCLQRVFNLYVTDYSHQALLRSFEKKIIIWSGTITFMVSQFTFLLDTCQGGFLVYFCTLNMISYPQTLRDQQTLREPGWCMVCAPYCVRRCVVLWHTDAAIWQKPVENMPTRVTWQHLSNVNKNHPKMDA